MQPESPLQSWLREFAESALRPTEVDDFVHSVDAEILAAIPEIADDPTLVEELHASTRAHWRTFLVSLTDEYRLALPPAAVALSLSIARRHHDINVLLKVYRVANQSVFRFFTEHTLAPALPAALGRDDVLIHLWMRAGRWIDESIERLIDHFTAERASMTEGAYARRAEIIGALVAGTDAGGDAERVLGHPLQGWHTAFVLSAPPAEETSLPLYDVAVRMCQRLDLPRPLTTLAGSRELWGWVATHHEPVVATAEVVELLDEHGLRVAIGKPCRGAAGFRVSHLQALAAQRIGLRVPATVASYDDLELVSLVGDGELARELVRREASALLGGSSGAEAVRSTVLAYLRSGQNIDATAQALFVHPNTVRYRINRAEQRLGRRVTDGAAALEVALAWLEVYGVDAI